MNQNQFFKTIAEHHEKEFPFVVYRKPNGFSLKAILQNDDVEYKTESFDDSGFVFAPFNSENDTILIPIRHSKTIEIPYVYNTLESNTSKIKQKTKDSTNEAKLFHINLVDKAIKEITKDNIFKKAKSFLTQNTFSVDSWDDFEKKISSGGFVYAHWDGASETEEKIKKMTKATIRCIPMDYESSPGKCIVTGKKSKGLVVFGKAY